MFETADVPDLRVRSVADTVAPASEVVDAERGGWPETLHRVFGAHVWILGRLAVGAARRRGAPDRRLARRTGHRSVGAGQFEGKGEAQKETQAFLIHAFNPNRRTLSPALLMAMTTNVGSTPMVLLLDCT